MNEAQKHTPKCPHCRAGKQPDERGNHWLVKSIIPARMTIAKCKDFALRAPAKAEGRT